MLFRSDVANGGGSDSFNALPSPASTWHTVRIKQGNNCVVSEAALAARFACDWRARMPAGDNGIKHHKEAGVDANGHACTPRPYELRLRHV
jgi:hypothetical protein